MNLDRFSVATFNLYNLQMPGKRMNPGQTPWTQEEFERKAVWISGQLRSLDADVVGFEECWSREALEQVIAHEGLDAEYELLADEATGSRIVCAAMVRNGLRDGRDPEWIRDFPAALRLESNDLSDLQAEHIAVDIDTFSRPILNFQVRLRDDPEPLTEVFVTHFKSKLPTRIDQETWFQQDPDLYKPHVTAIGSAISTIRRTAEATALRVLLNGVMKGTDAPVIVLGDCNDGQHSNTLNILTGQPRYLVGDVRRRCGHRPLHGADAAGVPRHPRRLLHPRVPGPARVAGPRAGQRAVLRQQQEAQVAVRRVGHQQRPPQHRGPQGQRVDRPRRGPGPLQVEAGALGGRAVASTPKARSTFDRGPVMDPAPVPD